MKKPSAKAIEQMGGDNFLEIRNLLCTLSKDSAKGRIGLHYQGQKLLLADYDTVTKDIFKVSDEMTKRSQEYIYPDLKVYGIDSDRTARNLAEILSSWVNAMVGFFAIVYWRREDDGTYLFWVEDDDSCK